MRPHSKIFLVRRFLRLTMLCVLLAGEAHTQEPNVIRLTNDPARDATPAWLVAGDTIVFVSNRGKSTPLGDLWAVNPDGSSLRKLIGVPNFDAGLHEPVGLGTTGDLVTLEAVVLHEWLRFQLSAKPALPVARTVFDGNSAFLSRLLLVEGGFGGGSFTVSRDGMQAAWMILRTPFFVCPTQAEIRTAPIGSLVGQGAQSAGTVVAASTLACAIGTGTHPFRRISFSPDGSQLVVARNPDPNSFCFDLEIYAIDGTLVRRLTNGCVDPTPVISWQPDWSTDNRIAFSSNRAGHFEIWTINPDGSDLRQVTFNGGEWPSWSPDGKRVAFQSDREGNLELYSALIFRDPIEPSVQSGFGFGDDWVDERPNGRCDPICESDTTCDSVGPRPFKHTGLDLKGRPGDLVMASADGTVQVADNNIGGGFGGAVVLEHDLDGNPATSFDRVTTLYLHVKPLVGQKKYVKQGEVIAKVHHIQSPHLHFGSRKGPFDASDESTFKRGALPPEGTTNCTPCKPKGPTPLPSFPEGWGDPKPILGKIFEPPNLPCQTGTNTHCR